MAAGNIGTGAMSAVLRPLSGAADSTGMVSAAVPLCLPALRYCRLRWR